MKLKRLCAVKNTLYLDYSGDSESIKTAGLLEMVVIDNEEG